MGFCSTLSGRRQIRNRMAKDVIISTSGLNCYGSRVLTSGIDLTQYQKNPILLWMHRRCFERDAMPIGRIENLRIDGDRLIGTPVFDEKDPFAKQIADKWENGFLRMASAGIEIVETSDAPEHILPGQRRATITRCKLEEVSIVDIGGNDDALQLYGEDGKILKLAAGEDCIRLPLLLEKKAKGSAPEAEINNSLNTNQMNKEILLMLGLPETASEQEAVSALRLMKEKADKADSLQLASINALVDTAIADRRITADKKEHFVSLGKTAGIESLRTTLELMRPQIKPKDIINEHHNTSGEMETYSKLSEVPVEKIPELRDGNPSEYARLYKAEYGIEL